MSPHTPTTTTTHPRLPHRSIIQTAQEKRGLIAVIIFSILATVGVFCLIVILVMWKNKRDRKMGASTDAQGLLATPTAYSGARGGQYQKLEEEEAGVWSVEMEERGGRKGDGEREGILGSEGDKKMGDTYK